MKKMRKVRYMPTAELEKIWQDLIVEIDKTNDEAAKKLYIRWMLKIERELQAREVKAEVEVV